MRDAVIVEAVRTPIGKRNGGLASLHSADISALVLQALAARTQLDPALVDDVVWGCVTQIGEQTFDIARTAVLSAGWPESVPGVTVDRQCGSSQQAVHFAAAGVISGQYDVAVAGGVEMMSRTLLGSANSPSPWGPTYLERYGAEPSQGLGAEQVAAQWQLSRTQLDEYALQSHERALSAQQSGAFDAQIIPVSVEGQTLSIDEGVRPGGTLDKLAGLRAAFAEDGTITAGNASQISDGAAALLITTSEFASAHGLTPLARIHTAVVTGVGPMPMLTGPIPATHKALQRSGLQLSDIGAFEVNEAFACVPLAWLKELDPDDTGLGKTLNPLGGAIALGHPLGATGARLMTTLVHHMRDNGIRYGLQTICEGGGQANATILELVG
jgi:acetyl-CoA acyltransferase